MADVVSQPGGYASATPAVASVCAVCGQDPAGRRADDLRGVGPDPADRVGLPQQILPDGLRQQTLRGGS